MTTIDTTKEPPTIDPEVRTLLLHAAQLRGASEYRSAGRAVRTATNAHLANIQLGTDLYAAVRLVAGTWDHIATPVMHLPESKQKAFVALSPVKQMFTLLSPAVKKIRSEPEMGDYAKDFENLSKVTADPKFTTTSNQAIFAMFG
jgi:hypothetical protein